MENIKIALLGFGTVGSGIWKVLNNNKEEIFQRCKSNIQISKILVRDLSKVRNADAPKELFTSNPNDILSDESIDIIVEVMGGIDPAKEYILQGIRGKKHIVTANKQLLATHGKEIFKEAYNNNVKINYEASVAGGIPIINAIKESLTANKIEEVMGIVNGTTNFILSKMSQEKRHFSSVLKEAQDMGYAEAAPAADVEGYDAAYKLAILSSLAFKTDVDVKNIYREGIASITPEDIEYAREFGYAVKLLAIGKNKDNELELRVHPTLIPESHPLASVSDSYNAVFARGNAVGDLMFYGRGAGDLPTASAVVSDIINIANNKLSKSTDADYNLYSNVKQVKSIDKLKSKYYIRLKVLDRPGVLGRVSCILGENNISLSCVIQKGVKDDNASLVFITHYACELDVKNALEVITSLPEVFEIANLIRIED
jgi:homoserine dehydrogenase